MSNAARLFVFFLTIMPFIGAAQIDSLRDVWANKGINDTTRLKALEEYQVLTQRVYPDSALTALHVYLELTKQNGLVRKEAGAYVNKANIFRDKGNFDNALRLYNKAIETAKGIDDMVFTGIITANKGNVYLEELMYFEAFQAFTAALKIFESENHNEFAAAMHNSIGNVYLQIENYELAESYLRTAQNLYRQLEQKTHNQAIIIMNLALIDFETEDYIGSDSLFSQALDSLELKEDIILRAGCYAYLARTRLALQNYQQASFFAEENLSLCEEIGNSSLLLEARVIQLLSLAKKSPSVVANEFVSMVKNQPDELSNDLKEDVFEYLMTHYKSNGQWEEALLINEKLGEAQKETQQKKNDLALIRGTIKYEIDLENEKSNSKLVLKNLRASFLAYSLLGVAVFIFIIVFLYQKHINIEKRTSLLNEIDRLRAAKSGAQLVNPADYKLSRAKIEKVIERRLNDTDRKVLQTIQSDPVISNAKIAESVFLSVDGIGSSLRRMYYYFGIQNSKYKKISLVMKSIEYSNK
jgi:tetratricopeptide (TPR) repeat protein